MKQKTVIDILDEFGADVIVNFYVRGGLVLRGAVHQVTCRAKFVELSGILVDDDRLFASFVEYENIMALNFESK